MPGARGRESLYSSALDEGRGAQRREGGLGCSILLWMRGSAKEGEVPCLISVLDEQESVSVSCPFSSPCPFLIRFNSTRFNSFRLISLTGDVVDQIGLPSPISIPAIHPPYSRLQTMKLGTGGGSRVFVWPALHPAVTPIPPSSGNSHPSTHLSIASIPIP
jgi:hypothetical protein